MILISAMPLHDKNALLDTITEIVTSVGQFTSGAVHENGSLSVPALLPQVESMQQVGSLQQASSLQQVAVQSKLKRLGSKPVVNVYVCPA
jgi:hypothetical protein